MSRHSSEELRELAAAYALGATTSEESAAVEQAMRTSPELAAEVAAYRDIAASIAAARAVAPPPELRDRFLAAIRSDVAPADATVVSLNAARAARAERTEAERTERVELAAPTRSWTTAALLTALAASLTFAVVLGRQNAALRRSLDARTDALATATASVRTRDRQIETVLEAETDLYVAQMTALGGGGDSASGPGTQLFWNERRRAAILHAFRLKPAPAGRSYQLWLIVDGKPVSAKVFNSDADGHAIVEDIAIPERVVGVTQVLLTEEPAGGSLQPTTTPFLGGALTKT